MFREIQCPRCGLVLPVDPKDDPGMTDRSQDIHCTIEAVIPATLCHDHDESAPIATTTTPPPTPGESGPRLGTSADGLNLGEGTARSLANGSEAPHSPGPDPILGLPGDEPEEHAQGVMDLGTTSSTEGWAGDAPGPRGPALGTVLLASYASAMTIACLVLWWQGRRPPNDGPPEAIPIDRRTEEGLRADRSRTVVAAPPIPADRMTDLGGTLQVGDLEFTPLGISSGPVILVLPHEGELREGGEGALRLHVRLRNRSRDTAFAPLDEAFLREGDRGEADSFVATASGGIIPMYPLAVQSEWSIEGETFRELAPGQTMETDIVSAGGALRQVEPEMTWRLRLRVSGSQTEVVGVRFEAGDVR